jgi:hypothetical protein
LRQLLQQAGMSEADLAQFSDEELLVTYQQILAQTQPSQGQEPQTVDLPVSQIEDLTPNQIRQLLEEAGIDKNILDNVSDEELMELVKETLSSY